MTEEEKAELLKKIQEEMNGKLERAKDLQQETNKLR